MSISLIANFIHRMRNNLETNRLRGIPDSSTSSTATSHSTVHQHNNIGFNKQTPHLSSSSSSYHRKSQSLDAATLSSQIASASMAGATSNSSANKAKNYVHKERYLFIILLPHRLQHKYFE